MFQLNKTKKVTHFLFKKIVYRNFKFFFLNSTSQKRMSTQKKKKKTTKKYKKSLEKKIKRKKQLDETHLQVHMGNWAFQPMCTSHPSTPSQFSPHLRRKQFGGLKCFLSTKHPLKMLSLHFSLLNFLSSLKYFKTNIF